MPLKHILIRCLLISSLLTACRTALAANARQVERLDGTRVYKWDHVNAEQHTILNTGDFDCVRVNGSKSNPSLCADILGDWREEIIWPTRDGQELRIFTTTTPTQHRLPTLMHDHVYRLGVAWQNVGYNQPAHPGFFLGAPSP